MALLTLLWAPLAVVWSLVQLLFLPSFWAGVAVTVALARSAASRRERQQARSRAVPALAECAPPTLKELKLSAALGDVPSWVTYPEYERVNWINQLLHKMWPFIAQYAGDTILESVNPILQQYRPAALPYMALELADLGTVPPVLAGVKVDQSPAPDEVMINLDLKYAGDPTIKLVIRLPPPLGTRLSVAVANLQVFAKLRILLKPLVGKLPVVACAGVSMIEAPTLDFQLKVAGGDVMGLPGVMSAVRSTVETILDDMLIWPKMMLFPLVEEVDLAKLRSTSADGMLYAKVIRGTQLPRISRFDDIDAFVVAWTRKSRKEVTAIVDNNPNPTFDEMMQFIVLHQPSGELHLELWDDEKIGGDRLVGTARVPVHTLEPGVVQPRELSLELEPKFKSQRDILDGTLQPQLSVELLYVPFAKSDEIDDGELLDDLPPDIAKRAAEAAVAVAAVDGRSGRSMSVEMDPDEAAPEDWQARLAQADVKVEKAAERGAMARTPPRGAQPSIRSSTSKAAREGFPKMLSEGLAFAADALMEMSGAVAEAMPERAYAAAPPNDSSASLSSDTAAAPAEGALDPPQTLTKPIVLPPDWELPPSGIIAVTVHSLLKLYGIKESKKLRVAVSLGLHQKMTKNCVPIGGQTGSFSVEEEVVLVGIDPTMTPNLHLRVLKNKRLSSKFRRGDKSFREVASLTIPLSKYAGEEKMMSTEEYHLEGISTGTVKLTLKWEVSLPIKRLRRRLQAQQLLG